MTRDTEELHVLDYCAAQSRDWATIARRVCKWTIGVALVSATVLLTAHLVRQTIEMSRESALLKQAPAAGVEVYRDENPLDGSTKLAIANALPLAYRIAFPSAVGMTHEHAVAMVARMQSPKRQHAIVVTFACKLSVGPLRRPQVVMIPVVIMPTTLTTSRKAAMAQPFTGGAFANLDGATQHLSITAAVCDPGDPSHASFTVNSDGEDVCYDIWLRDDENFTSGLAVAIEKRRNHAVVSDDTPD